jgi:allophanate hydrolase subunit 2
VLRPDARWPGPAAPAAGPVRVLEGSRTPPFFDAIDILVSTPWTVIPASDRMGLRLDGPPLPIDDGEAWGEDDDGWPDLPSSGVVPGTVQVPRDRRPIVLLADHQPTGGYPVVAIVISADVPRLGQLPPGATVEFERVTAAEARAALVEQRETLRAAAAALGEDAAWDDLWRWAR